jgi:hypothetical protein
MRAVAMEDVTMAVPVSVHATAAVTMGVFKPGMTRLDQINDVIIKRGIK